MTTRECDLPTTLERASGKLSKRWAKFKPKMADCIAAAKRSPWAELMLIYSEISRTLAAEGRRVSQALERQLAEGERKDKELAFIYQQRTRLGTSCIRQASDVLEAARLMRPYAEIGPEQPQEQLMVAVGRLLERLERVDAELSLAAELQCVPYGVHTGGLSPRALHQGDECNDQRTESERRS